MARHGARVPRLVAGVDLTKLPLSPLEGFVLSRIDGLASVALLADLTNLEVAEVEAMVERLIALGAAEWVRESVSLPRATGREPTRTPSAPVTVPPSLRAPPRAARVRVPRPSREGVGAYKASEPAEEQVDTSRPSVLPGATPLASHTGANPPPGEIEEIEVPVEERELDIDAERRERIDALFARLEELDHYEALGVPRDASRADIRNAYFTLSKVVHPDTMFRKRLGPYKAKMEAVFRRLTEAYEVLGKKRARQEYDRYLELSARTRDAEEVIEVPEPEPEQAEPREMTPEAKARARALMAQRLRSAVRTAEEGRIRTTPRPPPPPSEPPSLGRGQVLRHLATSLKASASHTGGHDPVQRHLLSAQRAEREGDLAEAARELRLAMALAPGRMEIEEAHARVSALLAASLAPTYEERAEYEQRYGKWADAAISWAKVFEGRPDDARAARLAAEALIEANGDLHRAKELAQRASELAPEDPRGHRTLGRVYLAAGLKLNARRALERAAALDPNDEIVDALLRDLDA